MRSQNFKKFIKKFRKEATGPKRHPVPAAVLEKRRHLMKKALCGF